MAVTVKTKGFEAAKEIFCEPCHDDLGESVPAEALCEDCEDYLCLSCLRLHDRYNREHTVISDAANIKFDTEHCNVHKNRPLHFYCRSCDVLSCVDCRKEKHHTCEYFLHLTELIDSMEDDGSRMETYAEAAKAATTTVRQNIEECISSGASWKWKIQAEVKTSRNEINMTFDQLEADIDEISLPDKHELENHIQAAVELEQYIDSHQSGCETKRNGFRFFIFQKMVNMHLKNLSEGTRSLAQAERIQDYSRKLRGLKPEEETDFIRLEKLCIKEQPQENGGTLITQNPSYCKGLFINIIYELFCLTAFIVFALKQRRRADIEGLLFLLGLGMVLSLHFKILLTFKNYTRVALNKCLAALCNLVVFIIISLFWVIVFREFFL